MRRLPLLPLLVLLLLLRAPPGRALDNGLARTPPMGFSTWSVFQRNINESLIRELADAMQSSGLAAAGYDYLLVDDGWEGSAPKGCTGCAPNRDDQGRLVVDAAKFPSGMNETAAYVHSKGLRFGLWFGHSMCATSKDTRLGSPSPIDYAKLDAEFFAWAGVDHIKADNCVDVANTTEAIAENFQRYAALGEAMNKTGRPIAYDVVLQVAHKRTVPAYDYGYLWSPEVYGKAAVTGLANSWWSLPVNKYNCWSCCVSGERIVDDSACTSPTGHACRRGLLPMLDTQNMGTPGFSKAGHWDWGGPGGWNHIDQLAVCVGKSWYGPGFTPTEQASQVALWAVLASPLIVSFDVRAMAPECKALVMNSRVIAVHQDKLGVPGKPLKNLDVHSADGSIGAQVWGRPLMGGGVAAVFFNRREVASDISATFAELGLETGHGEVRATDVWSGKVRHRVASPFTALAVPPHAAIFVTFTTSSQN
jgi:alpha-galactosidase